MKFWKQAMLFYLGGCAYMGLELLWRGRSHGSMFLLGGFCFLLIGIAYMEHHHYGGGFVLQKCRDCRMAVPVLLYFRRDRRSEAARAQ